MTTRGRSHDSVEEPAAKRTKTELVFGKGDKVQMRWPGYGICTGEISRRSRLNPRKVWLYTVEWDVDGTFTDDIDGHRLKLLERAGGRSSSSSSGTSGGSCGLRAKPKQKTPKASTAKSRRSEENKGKGKASTKSAKAQPKRKATTSKGKGKGQDENQSNNVTKRVTPSFILSN